MPHRHSPQQNETQPFACDVPTAFRLPAPGCEFDLDQYPIFAPLPDWPENLPARPRLVLTADRIEALRRDIDHGFLKTVWPRLWESHLQHHPQTPETLQQPEREHGYILVWRAMRWAVLRDERMLNEAIRWIDTLAACPISDHCGSLVATDVLSSMALAMDWIGEALPAATAAAGRHWLAVQGAQIARAAEAGAVWWRDTWLQNHTIVNECGIGLAGMALADAPEPSLRRVGLDLYRHAVTSIRKAVFFQPPDGSSPELCRYAYFMSEAQFLLFEALRSFSGEDLFGEFARRRIDYIIQQIIPSPSSDGDIFSWGDNARSNWPHPPTGLLYCLARRFRSSLAQGAADWLVRCGVGIDLNKTWMIPLHRDPTLPPAQFPPKDGSLPTSYHAEDQGLVTMRSSWATDATMVGLLCGPFQGHRMRRLADKDMGAAHRHPDNGAFQICAGGTYLTIDPGYEYLKSTANHNCILVDGRGQTGEGNTWLNVNNCLNREKEPLGITHFEDDSRVCRVTANVTGAYDPDLRIDSFVRRITYRRPDLLVVHDRIESTVPHEYRWLLHTDPQQRFTQMRSGYWRLEADGVGMDICVLEPDFEALCHETRLHRVARCRFVGGTRRLDLFTVQPQRAAEFVVVMKVLRGERLAAMPMMDLAVQREDDRLEVVEKV